MLLHSQSSYHFSFFVLLILFTHPVVKRYCSGEMRARTPLILMLHFLRTQGMQWHSYVLCVNFVNVLTILADWDMKVCKTSKSVGLHEVRDRAHSLWINNNVHLSCAHQRPELSHDTYEPTYDILYTCRA